jgi:integrase
MPRLPKGLFQREGRGYYTRKWVNGRDRWIALGRDLDGAKRKLRRLNREGPVLATRATVNELAREWLAGRVAVRRTAEGLQKATSRVGLYLGPFMGLKLVGKVTKEDLWEFRRWLETHERKVSLTSVWHILSDARCFFRWCEDAGKLDRSPFPRGLMPKLQEQPPKGLDPKEVEALVRIAEPYGFVVRLGLATGLRWGELTRAQAGDVDRTGVMIVSHTKSRKLRRIPLPPAMLAEVRQRIGRLVPFSESGSFARMARRLSGVERFHVHMLRHTFACSWVDRGGSLAALQHLLGHSSITTTQRYGRISDSMVKAEMMRLESVASAVASGDPPSGESVG